MYTDFHNTKSVLYDLSIFDNSNLVSIEQFISIFVHDVYKQKMYTRYALQ